MIYISPSTLELEVAPLIFDSLGLSPSNYVNVLRAMFGPEWIDHPERGTEDQQKRLADFIAG